MEDKFMKDILLNNQIELVGELSALTFSHAIHGYGFYNGIMKVKRLSNVYDEVPVSISSEIWNIDNHVPGIRVAIKGQIRTFNRHEGDKSKLIISVHVREISETSLPDRNDLYLEGYICKRPISRTTPLGREIADLLVAVNRPFGKSDYIPCICWGRNARFMDMLDVSTKVELHGRFQSRIYNKKVEGGYIEKIAYEVSAHKMKLGA